PLLLASSLPSDLARTGQAQTFTAAQTFSIAPTIKDASKDKGDNQAATMADLKSLEKSAWIQLDMSGYDQTYQGVILYRVDDTNKTIYVTGTGPYSSKGSYQVGITYLNLNKIVHSILSSSGIFQVISKKDNTSFTNHTSSINYKGAALTNEDPLPYNPDYAFLITGDDYSMAAHFTYDYLV
ncbi:hypothetical protein HMPREF9103_00118, partial [Lentilactobacillus parafarraginis F0439]